MNHPARDNPRALAFDGGRLEQLFGRSDLLPLWIAEPYLPLAPPIKDAIEKRANSGWYGYESRPEQIKDAFWEWMETRHRWSRDGLTTIVSPSVGTSIGVLINKLSADGDGVILQPPVFTDFKPLVAASHRKVVRNSLILDGDEYGMDLDGLAAVAAEPATRLMILCNPHNPIGRVWTAAELAAVAQICAQNDVTVIADEIHADLTLPPNTFTPFADAARGTGVEWAATHGPIKTFGLAGVCDTLLITDDEDIARRFKEQSNRLHLTRNNVFALAAFDAAYREGDEWLDDLLALINRNLDQLTSGLTGGVRTMPHQATYLAWLDFRPLGLDVPELASWLSEAGVALSPGHWFGREGAGFARMSIAVEEPVIAEAVKLLRRD